jgi:hypothetical protein
MTAALDEAELCTGMPDYYALPARIVMGVVFRSYLDSMVLTPFEIIHNHKLLRGLLEQTTLVENAMIRVSTVQARLPGQEAKARKAALQNAANELAGKAWSAQSAFNAAPKGRSVVDWLLDQPDGHSPTGDGHYDLCVALAADLAEHRTWAAKTDRIIDLLRSDRAEGKLLPILDSALADVLGSGVALQEILNTPAATPGELVVGQCKLVLGTTASVSMTGANRDAALNGVFRQNRAPYAKAAVLERVRRQLRSPSPLGRGVQAQEGEYLRDAMGYLLTPGGVIGGPPMAEAITLRYSRRLEQGGASAFRRSIIGVCEMQSDLFSRVNYLAAVSRSPQTERHVREIVDAVDAALGNEILIETAVLQNPDVMALKASMDAMQTSIKGASLPAETKVKLCGRAEFAVDVYAQHGRLVQRLKQLEPSLRRRAIRMAELAVSGLVRENGGLPVLRQSIMDIVRQPEFQNDVRSQQNSEMAQIEVRRLFDLLDQLKQGGQTIAAAAAARSSVPAPAAAAQGPLPAHLLASAPLGAAPPSPAAPPPVAPASVSGAPRPGGRALGGRARSYVSAAEAEQRPVSSPSAFTPASPAPSAPRPAAAYAPTPTSNPTGVAPAYPVTRAAPPPEPTPPTRMGAAPPGATRSASVAPPPPSGAGVAGVRCPNCFSDKPDGGACPECGYPAGYENRTGVHLIPGTQLQSRYDIGKLLGQGGFGATYLGWDDRLQVKVAVKEYYPANLISRVPGSSRVVPFSDVHAEGFNIGMKKFLEEARLLARLREIKEIVGVQDFFEANDTAYLIMELLQGRTLKKFVSENGGPLDPRRAVTILSPIMKALQLVHELGLIHRDVAPDNIFITSTGERKLLDFGAARHAAGQAANLTVILKPGYAPPEQYSHEGLQGPWTDVYAMCATIFVIICGKTPPDATTRFMNDRIPKLAEYNVQAPPAFEKALFAGLAMRHNERPQSMKDLQRSLTAALGV